MAVIDCIDRVLVPSESISLLKHQYRWLSVDCILRAHVPSKYLSCFGCINNIVHSSIHARSNQAPEKKFDQET